MNQFKYINGELWLDIPEPEEITLGTYALPKDYKEKRIKLREQWENRLHYPCSEELKAILKKGQVYELEKDFILNPVYPMGMGYGQEQYASIPQQMYGTAAIPLPKQPPTVKEQVFTLKDMLDCWDDGWWSQSISELPLKDYKEHYFKQHFHIDITKIQNDEVDKSK